MIRYFYCNKCGYIYSAKAPEIMSNIEDIRLHADVKFTYDCECGNIISEIDPEMYHVISTLNNTKLSVKDCFCGDLTVISLTESYVQNARIEFGEQTTIELFNDIIGKHGLPKDWSVHYDLNQDTNIVEISLIHQGLYSNSINMQDFNIIKKNYINDVIDWCNKIIRDSETYKLICDDILERV